jgi:hypothetical protein
VENVEHDFEGRAAANRRGICRVATESDRDLAFTFVDEHSQSSRKVHCVRGCTPDGGCVLNPGQALATGSQRKDHNIRGHVAAIDRGEPPPSIDSVHFAENELELVLLGQILQIHQVLLDVVLARDHPYGGGIHEEMASFRDERYFKARSPQMDGGFHASETASEHQRSLFV